MLAWVSKWGVKPNNNRSVCVGFLRICSLLLLKIPQQDLTFIFVIYNDCIWIYFPLRLSRKPFPFSSDRFFVVNYMLSSPCPGGDLFFSLHKMASPRSISTIIIKKTSHIGWIFWWCTDMQWSKIRSLVSGFFLEKVFPKGFRSLLYGWGADF